MANTIENTLKDFYKAVQDPHDRQHTPLILTHYQGNPDPYLVQLTVMAIKESRVPEMVAFKHALTFPRHIPPKGSFSTSENTLTGSVKFTEADRDNLAVIQSELGCDRSAAVRAALMFYAVFLRKDEPK